jgi:hypothetical protein
MTHPFTIPATVIRDGEYPVSCEPPVAVELLPMGAGEGDLPAKSSRP